jgi:hypothetical protein
MTAKDTTGRIDFIGIGAAKCGTTWLAAMLMQHPDIFIPSHKEIHYFNRYSHEEPGLLNPNFTRPPDWYLKHFRGASPGQVIGEISPEYFWNENCPAAIRDFAPDVKILAMVRDPAKLLLSRYMHFLRLGHTHKKTFEEHLEDRPHLMEHGLYHRCLSRYYDVFSPEQIRVYLLEDVAEDSRQVLRDVEAFLGVEAYIPEDIDDPVNAAGAARLGMLSRMLSRGRVWLRKNRLYPVIWAIRAIGVDRLSRRIHQWNVQPMKEKPQIAAETLQRIRDYYRDDVERLEKLLGRDLSAWK